MRVAGTFCVSLLAGCVAAGPDPVGSDAGRRDGGGRDAPRDAPASVPPDTYDPRCHWDCFGEITCVDGEVRQSGGLPIPCAEWTGSCGYSVLGVCASGCGDTPPVLPGAWELWCEGSEERRAGDPCTLDADCQPPAPEITSTGIVRGYLACDAAVGECVAVDPPVAPDSGEACGLDVDALLDADVYAHGVLAAPGCSSGYCLFLADVAPACDRDGCATTCEDDWDCPPELFCAERPDWTGRTFEGGSVATVRVCADVGVETGTSCH
jgi:hypothetical protein